MQAVGSEYDREIAVLLSMLARQQHPVLPTIKPGTISRKLSRVDGVFQDPTEMSILPPPERFQRKKKDRSHLKKTSWQSLHIKYNPEEDSKHARKTEPCDEYDRVLEKLLCLDG
jgi:hypothetical protein